ncbi:MAG: acyl-phosphate glycerol 3-phosphate acyltransferase [Proteobacteria bacterium]|nr:acyl-phosphate glycerol 3-phosphate acyltransferase [Pseudomonadota bacterium]
MIWFRSALFWLAIVILTPLFALIGNLIRPLPPLQRYRIMSCWAKFMVPWLQITCGLRYRVIGQENIPAGPAMVMCKHQSAWETMALQVFFPPQVWVMKREILSLPFFGWAISTLSPIAIDRTKRTSAQKMLMEQGRDRVAKGFWIVIFPEGTRVAPGKRGQYKHGGARLAVDVGVPIVPVALNSGEFWPRNSFLKWPGEITVVIGKPIETAGRTPHEITTEVEGWIEGEMEKIAVRGPHFPRRQDQ